MGAQEGVYVTLEELVSYEASTRQMASSFSRVSSSLLQGNRPSRINGRGGAFDQIRHYQQGDDVRDIDWNVTARMRGVPFIRVFNEERERPFFVVVDQTADMFFGTQCQLKSVLAVRTAAQLLWMSHHKKQPYGLIIVTEQQVEVFSPRHHRGHLIRLFASLVQANQMLSADVKETRADSEFLIAIQHLRRQISTNALVAMISDFNHVSEPAWQLMTETAARTQCLVLPVYDGIINAWPTRGEFLSTWGGLVTELQFSSHLQRQQIAERAEQNFTSLQSRLTESGIASRPITTWQASDIQLQEALLLRREQ
ncbi:DUF58 domain-containing protein [Scandinavium sp. H11S7]|uniref:DUF58 domain-containing protein n=1 Tax=Scandinavium hiltneri TaxID=2926519 RepID=A0ABT2DXX6_9ENTR|nr:DUF58 domain-containing protein [Scandinavium hiltneri]MCS2160048.1 DUF58 domain-containing protein [Scandinavium hiltneri]